MFTRILVHAEAQPEESDGPIRLQCFEPTPVRVLGMSSTDPSWWITDPSGEPTVVNPHNVRVCAGRDCTVDACTRAESLRAAEAESDAIYRRHLAETAAAERERAAVLESYRETDVEIANLAFTLERLGMAPPSGEPHMILNHVHALALELKSRRDEQGMLRDHPSDPPGNRIRYWMARSYPTEREKATAFSEWVISKLTTGKLAEAELSALVEFVFTEFPSERAVMATNGTAATVQRLLQEQAAIHTELDTSLRLTDHIGRLHGYLSVQLHAGEPVAMDNTIDVAIRYIGELQDQIATRKEVQRAQLGPIMVAVDHLFPEDIEAVLDGKGWTDVETAIPAILEHVAGRLPKPEPA